MSVLFWVGLAVLTFVLLVAGYATGFWGSGDRAPPASRVRHVIRPPRRSFTDSPDASGTARVIEPHGVWTSPRLDPVRSRLESTGEDCRTGQ